MRTQEEVVKRIQERAPRDPFGFETDEYLHALDFEHAKEFLLPEATEEKFNEAGGHSLKTDEDVKKAMTDYFDFAYEKIRNGRGISANRSVMHYIAWLWLVGDEEMTAWVDHEYKRNYHAYGQHIIDHIAEKYRPKQS